jgi:hypothetical protein
LHRPSLVFTPAAGSLFSLIDVLAARIDEAECLGVSVATLRPRRRFRISTHSRTVDADRASMERGNIMTVEDNYDVVRRGYAAFSAGDTDTLTELFAPDIVHTVPGSSAVSGAHKGPQNVLAMYGKLAELSGGSVRVELEDVLSDGGSRVIAIHRANAERNGQTLAVREALLFTIVDGKVTEIQDFFGDIEAADAFWT